MSPGEYQAHHMWIKFTVTKLTETKVSRQNAVLPIIHVEQCNCQSQCGFLSLYSSLTASHVMSRWLWQRRQLFSLYPLRDHMLTFLVHAVLTLLDLFHVLIHSARRGQPHLRSAFVCLCSVHIKCSNVILEDNCAFLNNFWEEESVLNNDSSASYTPTYAANSAKQCRLKC